MQAMAPGKRSALQAGHFVGVCGAAAGWVVAVVPDDDVGWLAGTRGTEPNEGAGGAAGGLGTAAEEALAAATASRDGADAPTVNGFWHVGQRNCLPAESSASLIAVAQWGHLITSGIAGSVSDEVYVRPLFPGGAGRA